jgi:hypothetical protein
VLAIGIVVDDAIVVVENVERALSEGLAPVEAARRAMSEVGGAVVAASLVLVRGVRAERLRRRHLRAVLPPVRGHDRCLHDPFAVSSRSPSRPRSPPC